MKKILMAVLTVALLVVPQLDVWAVALAKDVEATIAEQGFYFQDYDVTDVLNVDRADSERGDEQRLVYLTDIETGELIEEVEVGEEYILHCYLVNDGELNDGLTNVSILIGQGDDYDSVRLNAVVYHGDREDGTHGCVEFYSSLPVVNRATDAWVKFKPVGKAKLYNQGGLLNGAQVNHKKLFAGTSVSGILIGYNDQDGFLPYGKKYACEIRVRVRLEPIEPWSHCWSDPSFEGRYTGKIIDESGNLVDVSTDVSLQESTAH